MSIMQIVKTSMEVRQELTTNRNIASSLVRIAERLANDDPVTALEVLNLANGMLDVNKNIGRSLQGLVNTIE